MLLQETNGTTVRADLLKLSNGSNLHKSLPSPIPGKIYIVHEANNFPIESSIISLPNDPSPVISEILAIYNPLKFTLRDEDHGSARDVDLESISPYERVSVLEKVISSKFPKIRLTSNRCLFGFLRGQVLPRLDSANYNIKSAFFTYDVSHQRNDKVKLISYIDFSHRKGRTYLDTVVHVKPRGRFALKPLGDWVEKGRFDLPNVRNDNPYLSR